MSLQSIQFSPMQRNICVKNQPAFGNRLRSTVLKWEGSKAGAAYVAHSATGVGMPEAYAWAKGIGDFAETGLRGTVFLLERYLRLIVKNNSNHTHIEAAKKTLNDIKTNKRKILADMYTYNPLNILGQLIK